MCALRTGLATSCSPVLAALYALRIKSMNWVLIIFLILTLLLCGRLLWRNEENQAAYFLFGSVLILVVIVFLVTVLEFKIGGSIVNLENATQELEKSKREMQEVSRTISKVALFLSEKEENMGDFEPEYREQIDEYLKELSPYVDENLSDEVKDDFNRAKEKYYERTGQ